VGYKGSLDYNLYYIKLTIRAKEIKPYKFEVF